MNSRQPANPAAEGMLNELAALGVRGARVVTRLMEIEQAAAEVVALWLPEPGAEKRSFAGASAAGLAVDAVNEAMAQATARADALARAFDRLSRSVRRSLAMIERMAAGWPRAGSVDDRAAMLRRQVAGDVARVIRRDRDGEAAERLFDELAERLEDPALDRELADLPVDQVVRRICRDLGLAGQAIEEACAGDLAGLVARDTC